MSEGLMYSEQIPFGNFEPAAGRVVTKLDLKEASGKDLAKKLNTSTFAALDNGLVRQTGADRHSVEVQVSQAVQTILSDVDKIFDEAKKEHPEDPFLLRRRVTWGNRDPRFLHTERIISLSEKDPSLMPEEKALAFQYLALRLVEPQQPMRPIKRTENNLALGVEKSSNKPKSKMERIYEANRARVQASAAQKLEPQTWPDGARNTSATEYALQQRINAVEAIIDGMIAGPSSGEILLEEVSTAEQISMIGTGNFPNAVKPSPAPLVDRRSFHNVSSYLKANPFKFRESPQAISSLQRVMGVEKPDLHKYSKYNSHR